VIARIVGKRIVWAALGMLAYELFAINTGRCETWTDAALRRSRKSVLIWGYWVWLGIHLLTGGKV
jgi:hypothetical protein